MSKINNDLVVLLCNNKYSFDKESIDLLSRCLGGGEYKDVDHIVSDIDSLIIQLKSLIESIERKRDGI